MQAYACKHALHFWVLTVYVCFLFLSQVTAVSGSMPGAHGSNRSVPRPMNVVGMPRLPPQAMAAYNLTSQAAMGDGMNPGSISKQRGVPQGHPQQV